MAISAKQEKSLLNHDEWELVSGTHHPALHDRSAEDLQAARKRLREIHAKEQGFARHKRRVGKGTADARGGSFPGTAERPAQRKQVFAHAIRRVNSEIERRNARRSRDTIVSTQKKVLAKRRAAPSTRPANTPTAKKGPAKVENTKARTKVPGAKVGSVTKQTARAQGRKDS